MADHAMDYVEKVWGGAWAHGDCSQPEENSQSMDDGGIVTRDDNNFSPHVYAHVQTVEPSVVTPQAPGRPAQARKSFVKGYKTSQAATNAMDIITPEPCNERPAARQASKSVRSQVWTQLSGLSDEPITYNEPGITSSELHKPGSPRRRWVRVAGRYCCQQKGCKDSYVNLEQARDHELQHSTPDGLCFTCPFPECGQRFKWRHYMRLHQRTLHGMAITPGKKGRPKGSKGKTTRKTRSSKPTSEIENETSDNVEPDKGFFPQTIRPSTHSSEPAELDLSHHMSSSANNNSSVLTNTASVAPHNRTHPYWSQNDMPQQSTATDWSSGMAPMSFPYNHHDNLNL